MAERRERQAHLARHHGGASNVLNQPITTAFPIRETIKDWKPGAYFVVVWNSAKPPAKDDDDDSANDDDEESGKNLAGMWVMDTDIALTSLTGRDGLTVFARSLASRPAAARRRGRAAVARQRADRQGGHRRRRPRHLPGRPAARPRRRRGRLDHGDRRQAKQEFSRLELTKAAFDLSDRGIEGRALPGPVDAFLYTERGVYRPGETVQLMAMLRDDAAVALKDMPVTLIVKRPDGSEFTRYTSALPASGALYQAIDLPEVVAPRPVVGRRAHRSQGRAGRPGRVLGRGLRAGEAQGRAVDRRGDPAHRQDRPPSTSRADFLYGAPASGLKVESDLRVTVDPNPFPAFANYSFGSAGRAQELRAAADHARRARDRRQGQVADRMGGRPGEGHRPAAARADHRARVRARQRPRHQDRQVAAAAHARRLSRRPSDLRGPLRPAKAPTPASTSWRVDADGKQIADYGRLLDRAHHLRLPVVPERRPLALAEHHRRARDRCRHAGSSRPMRR